MYKITFGLLNGGNRGVEYASRVNPEVVKALWGHPGTKVNELGYDENGNVIYHLTDRQIKVNPLLVTCEYFDQDI